jgi:hypothetical protein
MFAVQPKPEGVKSPIVTLSVSPGLTPSTKIGPVTGLTRAKSSPVRSAAFDSFVTWPPPASTHSNSSVVPGATFFTGGIEWSHPK